MSDVNFTIQIGRLTRDAELKYTSAGMAVTKFAIAVNRRVKQGESWAEEANFFNVVLWGRLGESLNQFLVKGKQVAVNGELRQNRWTSDDGTNHSTVEIVADGVQLLGGGQQGGQQPASAADSTVAHAQGVNPGPAVDAAVNTPAGDGQKTFDGIPPDFPDDIPF